MISQTENFQFVENEFQSRGPNKHEPDFIIVYLLFVESHSSFYLCASRTVICGMGRCWLKDSLELSVVCIEVTQYVLLINNVPNLLGIQSKYPRPNTDHWWTPQMKSTGQGT